MLTLKKINENPEEVIRKLAKKNFDANAIVDQIVELDNKRRSTQVLLDSTLAEINSLSRTIGTLIKEGKKEEASQIRDKVSKLKETSRIYEDTLRETEEKIQNLLVILPNLPHDSVPEGKSAEDNIVEKTGGKMPKLPADALPHWELAKKYDIIDFELGVKITGAGFPVYKGKGAQL
ncbi:MAG: serine--tRNA ligase, partial [Dysgonamonadaceae bacterium]